jgi:putative endonuclease
MSDVNNLGAFGERLAFDFLISEGYKILAQNYRFKKAEVDILAQKGTYLVAVEVKTRRSKAFGAPEEFLKPHKYSASLKRSIIL